MDAQAVAEKARRMEMGGGGGGDGRLSVDEYSRLFLVNFTGESSE